MFVNYFITIYLHNYIVRVLFAYYYIARIIVIVILFGDTRNIATEIFRAGRNELCELCARPGNNQSLFYRVAHLIAARIETS